MYISYITTDNWTGNTSNGQTLRDDKVTLDALKKAIMDLDGDKKTIVGAGPNEDSEESLQVAGGDNNNYLVIITYDNETFYNLVDSTKDPDEFITMDVGGQTSEYPANYCVSLGKALRAAEHYAKTGKVLMDLEWEIT